MPPRLPRPPPRSAFEWDPLQASNHSYVSVTSNNYPAYYFVNQARANGRSFPSEAALNEVVIYNFSPVFPLPTDPTDEFDQLYYFPPAQ